MPFQKKNSTEYPTKKKYWQHFCFLTKQIQISTESTTKNFRPNALPKKNFDRIPYQKKILTTFLFSDETNTNFNRKPYQKKDFDRMPYKRFFFSRMPYPKKNRLNALPKNRPNALPKNKFRTNAVPIFCLFTEYPTAMEISHWLKIYVLPGRFIALASKLRI